ncbi:fimbrial biogenesis chaperone [Marilutibacter maris]|uniref:fimbrial biogenesis chaperone n=1 Tax=Marilutibacter maris TaxID=1605891 RepID=UPI002010F428|nr:molecular chaperone [Lysobacter maris]
MTLFERRHRRRPARAPAVPGAVLTALLTALLSGLPSPADATHLQVAPTSVTIPAERNAEGLTLSNSGDAPMHAQVRVFGWHQEDGEDRLQATTAIVLSPPMAEIAPGSRQLVRIVRPGPPPAGTEASYRIVVDEIPGQGRGDAGADPTGLRFVMRYSIPLFVSPTGPGPALPTLQTRVTASGGERFIEIGNDGRGHAQVADLAFVATDGTRTSIAAGLSGYVLPGQRRRWKLPAWLVPPLNGVFKARINGEPAERTLAPDAVAL